MTKKSVPLKTRFFYGWVIVIVSGLTLFFSGPGQTYSISIFIDSYINEFGWSRSIVSGLYSIGTLCAGLLMGFVGRLLDKYGHRKMTPIISILLGLACIWMSIIISTPMLLVGFFMLRLFGQGSMSLTSLTLPPQWFIKKRGRAISIVSIGGGLSLAILPILNAWLIQNYGWRFAWWTLAVLLWAVMTPVSQIFIRDSAEEIGLLPDGQDHGDTEANTAVYFEEKSWTLSEAIKTRAFWIIIYNNIVRSAIVTGLVFHQISIMAQVGLGIEIAAMVSSIVSIIRVPIVLLAGQIVDRFQLRYLLSFTMTLMLISLIILIGADSLQTVIIYGVLLGVMMGFESLIGGVIWPNYYGRKHLSTIRGVTMMVGVIGSALGPLPYGIAFDIFGGYTEALLFSLTFPFIGIIAGFLAIKPMKK
jgi:MFS family permease